MDVPTQELSNFLETLVFYGLVSVRLWFVCLSYADIVSKRLNRPSFMWRFRHILHWLKEKWYDCKKGSMPPTNFDPNSVFGKNFATWHVDRQLRSTDDRRQFVTLTERPPLCTTLRA